jgi:hypothetical protein
VDCPTLYDELRRHLRRTPASSADGRVLDRWLHELLG